MTDARPTKRILTENTDFVYLVTGLLGYQESTRLVVIPTSQRQEEKLASETTGLSSSGTFTVPQTADASRFHRGIWDSDREISSFAMPGIGEAVISAVEVAYSDVLAMSRITVELPELITDPNVRVKFAELVAAHLVHFIQRTAGRRFYVTKVAMTNIELSELKTWFSLLARDGEGRLVIRRINTTIDPRTALQRGYDFGTLF